MLLASVSRLLARDRLSLMLLLCEAEALECWSELWLLSARGDRFGLSVDDPRFLRITLASGSPSLLLISGSDFLSAEGMPSSTTDMLWLRRWDFFLV
jgi:hypothetical protein